jgi:hypothetical protein
VRGGLILRSKESFRITIKTLQKCTQRSRQVREALQVKRRRHKEEATNIADTEGLVTEEIEMLKVVFYIW